MTESEMALPKKLQDQIDRMVAEGIAAALQKLPNKIPPAAPEDSAEKIAAIKMLKGLGYDKPGQAEEAYKMYYANDEIDMGGED